MYIYGSTHNGGDIRLVKSNMYNNNGDEKNKMKELCEECGFFFQPTIAAYANGFKRWGIVDFNEEDIAFINELYDNPEQILHKKPTIEQDKCCELLENGIFIDYDGKAMLCCTILHKEAIYKKFLEMDLEEINKMRRESWICKKCMQYGMAWK